MVDLCVFLHHLVEHTSQHEVAVLYSQQMHCVFLKTLVVLRGVSVLSPCITLQHGRVLYKLGCLGGSAGTLSAQYAGCCRFRSPFLFSKERSCLQV